MRGWGPVVLKVGDRVVQTDFMWMTIEFNATCLISLDQALVIGIVLLAPKVLLEDP